MITSSKVRRLRVAWRHLRRWIPSVAPSGPGLIGGFPAVASPATAHKKLPAVRVDDQHRGRGITARSLRFQLTEHYRRARSRNIRPIFPMADCGDPYTTPSEACLV